MEEWKTKRLKIIAEVNDSLKLEAITDIICIIKLNDRETAIKLISDQFLVIDNQDIIKIEEL